MNLGHHLSVRLQAFASCWITRAEIIIKRKKRWRGAGGGFGYVTKNPVWNENFIQTQHRTSSGEARRIMRLTHDGEESCWDAGRTEHAGEARGSGGGMV